MVPFDFTLAMQPSPATIQVAFRSLAESIGAAWTTSENFCTFSKNGIIVQVIWMIDGIRGIFVTLVAEGHTDQKRGYGLSYLVQFRGGNDQDLAESGSDNLDSQVRLTQKYALPFLTGAARDFDQFSAFAAERVRSNIEKMPPVSEIKTNKTVRAEWIRDDL